jgi:hypothetical protein
MSKFKKVVFSKSEFNNEGNIVANMINIKKQQQSVYTPGTLVVPIYTNTKTKEHYMNKVLEVVSEPIQTRYDTKGKPQYDMSVKVRTKIESMEPIKVRKNTINSALRYGTTKIDASSDGVKGIAYKEFERFVSLAIRS